MITAKQLSWLEHSVHTRRVEGSNPPVATNMLLTFVLQRFLFIKPNMKTNEYKSGIHSLHIKSELEGLFISINFSPKRQFCNRQKKLSEELGLSEQEIRTSIKHLILTNEITKKTTKKFTIISVNNYDMYYKW